MEFSLSELFATISSFLGILLIVIILFKAKGKSDVRYSLMFLLSVATLIVFFGELSYSGKIRIFPHLLRIDSSIHYLLGPAAYFYTLTSLKKDFKFRWLYLLNLLPFFVFIINFMPFYLTSGVDKLNYYDGLMADGTTMIMQKQYLIKTISLWCYFFAQLYLFNKYLIQNKSGKKHDKNITSWFIVFFGCQLACYFGVAFDQFTGLQLFQDSYVFAMNMVSLMLLTIGIALLFFPKLLYGTNTDKPIQEKYSHSKLNDESKLKILNDWKVFIEDLQKPYLNPKLSLGEVAEILNTSSRRLSQVINEKTGMNFNDYINSLRVQEAKQLLIGDDMEKLTIETIALKSGFNSKSPFYAAFKKHTGQTPRQFITAKQGG